MKNSPIEPIQQVQNISTVIRRIEELLPLVPRLYDDESFKFLYNRETANR